MKFFPALLFVTLLLLPACKKKPEALLARKWQETGIENAQVIQMIREQEAFLDTLGSHTTREENILKYGTSNIDSYKLVVRNYMDQMKRQQQQVVDSTWFDFRDLGLVYLHSDEGLDSASWYFDEDGALMLDEMKLKGAGSRIRMEVLRLNDTSLQLKFVENQLSSIASFVPYEQ